VLALQIKYAMHKSLILKELQEAQKVLSDFVNDETNINQINLAANLMIESLKKGGKIISCGNGGSMADAMHFAEELSGRFRDDRAPLAAISISDPTHISCVSNDYGYDHVFSRYIQAIGNEADVLLAISTSGNSLNVIKAIQMAKERKMFVVALTGKDGGKISGLADVEIRVPHYGYADRIQEVHIKVIHILIHLIEKGVL
jgi:D-sedoheptulose 7-phosphate isomerase